MGKTRAECSQNACTSHASAFLSHWNTTLANSSPKSDIKKEKKKRKKKKKPTLFFRILRSVGRGQHKHFFFWPKVIMRTSEKTKVCLCVKKEKNQVKSQKAIFF